MRSKLNSDKQPDGDDFVKGQKIPTQCILSTAVAHAILISIYHMLSRQEVYQDLGYGYLDQRKHKSVTNQLVRRLERLGYQVHLSMEETIPTTPVELAG